MRRRELLSAGAVLAAGIAGCAAEPIEEQNESEVEEESGPGDGIEDEEGGNETDEDEVNDEDDADVEETEEEEVAADESDDAEDAADDTEDDTETDTEDAADDTADDEDAVDDAADDGDAETDDDADDEDAVDEDADDGGDGATDDGDDTEDDPETDDADDATDDEEFEADETFEGDEETEALTIGVVGPAGERIDGATVAGERASDGAGFEGETGDDGTHTAEIPEGLYTIEIDHPAYEGRTVEYAHEEAGEIGVELDAVEAVPAVSGLRLIVADTDDEPIEGASIRGEGAPLEADVPLVFTGETDADGKYTDLIYENEYVIELDHPDYQDRTVEYDHDGPTELVVELGPA